MHLKLTLTLIWVFWTTTTTTKLVFCAESEEEPPPAVEVKTAVGTIQGHEVHTTDGFQYYQFLGIPYAEAPVGPLRFKPPIAASIFNETFKAVRDGPLCVQMDPQMMRIIGQEDCLHLNVYTTEITPKPTPNIPVMVYFHGGVFEFGTSSIFFYGPTKLIRTGVILVTLNYRLGPFGFLSTGDGASPGNYGLLDQVLALKWIQQNIGSFGGSTSQITIFGQDAGAASALYHMLSPLSTGLFHRVIAQSGSPLCSNSFQTDPLEFAQELARRLKCPSLDSSQKIVECLREKPAEELSGAAFSFHALSYFPIPFLPVVERTGSDSDFLPDTPVNLLKESKVNKAPVILGLNKDEGSLLFYDVIRAFPQKEEAFFNEALPEILALTKRFKHNIKEISMAVKEQYFEGVDLTSDKDFNNTMVEVFSDFLFRHCVVETALLLSDVGWPTYLYVFEHKGKFSTSSLMPEQPDLGVCHSDELQYLFNGAMLGPLETDEADKKVQKILQNLWSNFAKTSMPTPNKSPEVPLTWVPMNPGKVRYLKIDNEPALVESYRTNKMEFWNKKVEKLSRAVKKDEL